jgi:transcriptional regulator with XRE-family HTH domain
MTEPADDRQRLAGALRDLRQAAGLSTTQLAERLGWSQSKVSKTELGRTRPAPVDVERWVTATGAGPDVQAELVRIAADAAEEATDWRRELAPGRRRKQEEIHQLETAASVIRVFSPDVIVGLAQTPAYAEAVFRLGRQAGPAESLQDVVDARLARQAVLADETKRFELLIGETAARRMLVSAPAMSDQLKRLSEVGERANVALGLIPFDADERVHQYHGFAIIGDPVVDDAAIVLVETLTRALAIRNRAEIIAYVDHFAALRAGAVEGEELRALLAEIASELGGAARDV